jgi:hypothetical protein
MPWVDFTADFDWDVKPNVTIAYKGGTRVLVSRAIADAAKAAGKVADERRETPRKRDIPKASGG